MDLKKIFKNDKAVSPVIGVVLMVAITVILAAAIGSSVFGQGPAKSAPQANIDISINISTRPVDPGYIKFEHLGGEPIYFTSNSTTKVMAALDGESAEIYAGILPLWMWVKWLQFLLMILDSETHIRAVKTGDTVNIKIIDVQTKQLICDKNVRF